MFPACIWSTPVGVSLKYMTKSSINIIVYNASIFKALKIFTMYVIILVDQRCNTSADWKKFKYLCTEKWSSILLRRIGTDLPNNTVS